MLYIFNILQSSSRHFYALKVDNLESSICSYPGKKVKEQRIIVELYKKWIESLDGGYPHNMKKSANSLPKEIVSDLRSSHTFFIF